MDFEDPGYELELFVKESKDGKGLGDCIQCHRFMMVLALKGVTAHVTTINLLRKPDFFAKAYAGVKLPCLVHNGKVIDDVIDIESHMEKSFPDPPLVIKDDKGALRAGDKVFQKFSAWIRNRNIPNDARHQDALLEELIRLNNFLGSSRKIPGTFLAGNELSMPDCVLLPKLHHLRVALKFFKDFLIPDNFCNLHNYLQAADMHEVFAKTCCEESEILEGWGAHVGDPKKARLILRLQKGKQQQ